GERQPLFPHRPDPGSDPDRDRGPRLAGVRPIVGRRTVLQPGAEEADQITSDRAIAAMLSGLPAAFLLDPLLPSGDQPRRLPMTMGEGGPSAANGGRLQTERRQAGYDGAPALQKAAAHHHPEQMEQAQVGTDRQRLRQARQQLRDAIDYGGHQGGLRWLASFRIPCLMSPLSPPVSGN